MLYRAASQDASTAVVTFPAGVDVHWETENRVIWNEQERVTEEQELTYEVSWIRELDVWRRFLRSQRTVRH
jgi:hypothetical protein